MRVVVEALAADFGGIRTYVENLLAGWSSAHPDDELVVLVKPGAGLATGPHLTVELRVPDPQVLARPLVQTWHTRRVVERYDADAVLATLPATGLRHPGVPLAVVVHDLRHELRPEQFSRGRRLLRRAAYDLAYRAADGFVAVSRRSLDDLHRLHPRLRAKPAAVVHHGADHVRGWSEGTPGAGGYAVTFAHHSNKNPDLLLDAWADGRRRGRELPPVKVLGAGAERDRLVGRAAELGVGDLVEPLPYLPDGEFRQVLARAGMVVFPSDFEGFGLPALEGMLLGVPVVVGPDPAVLEVTAGHATVMADWTPAALADAVQAATRVDQGRLATAREHAATYTWERSARQTRALLGRLGAA